MNTTASDRDSGFVSAVEIVFLGIVVFVGVVFLGFLGRLSAAGLEVTNVAQDAARAASQQRDAAAGRVAAIAAVDRSNLDQRCRTAPITTMTWEPESAGQWPGSIITVTVSCQVDNASLSGIWTPGNRTVAVSDAQIVDRFRR